MTDSIRIGLLGGFAVEAGNRAVPEDAWRLRKAKSLVKLLALAPAHRLHRDRIAELLWPDRDADAAQNNLHQAVHAARRALDAAGADGARCLELRDGTLVLCPDGALDVDVERFESAAVLARQTPTATAYRTALEHATGELLPEDAYEDWAAPRRAAVRELRLALLVELADVLAADGDRAGAIEALQRAVVDDALHEAAHRRLMGLFTASGRRQDALAQYGALKAALDRDLAAEPDPETRRLYRELLAGDGAAEAGAHATGDRSGARPERRTNLPAPLTSFIGREREHEEVARLLARARLVTLTGPGGCGKTRLALEVARRRTPPRDGTWLVELAALSHDAAVAEAVASALGIHAHGPADVLGSVVEHVAGRELLIVLDNCEHLVGACADVAGRLLREAPALRILATSREPLRVAGEVTWRVPSLSLPALDGALSELTEGEAVQLFVARAADAAPQFALTAQTAQAVAEVCRRVDGMPLAIELAAARVAVLSPAQIAERLRASLDVLAGGPRGSTRQQTLRATLDWSHDLLTTEERVLLRRLSVFAGSFDLAAAEDVCGGGGLGSVPVLELLGRLVDKSLVVVEPGTGEYRYVLLESVRRFAGEHLAAAREEAMLRAHHREHFAARAQRHAADPERLERDHANLSAALADAMRSRGEPALALRLASALCRYWMARGHFAEGARWLDAVLALPGAPGELRAALLLDACALDVRRGVPDRLVARAREVVATRDALGDAAGVTRAGAELALMEWMTSDYDAAQRDASAAVARADAGGHAEAAAIAEHLLGAVALCRGDFPEAADRLASAVRRLDALRDGAGAFFPAFTVGYCTSTEAPTCRPRMRFEETVVLFRRAPPRSAAAYALVNAGFVARTAGDDDAALGFLSEALDRFGAVGDEPGRSVALNVLGHAARQRGDLDEAEAQLEASLALRRRLGELRGVAIGLSGFGLLALATGEAAAGRRRLLEARELYAATADAPGLAYSEMHLGMLELDLGDPAAAGPLLERSLAIVEPQWMLRSIGWTHLLLAEAATACGHGGGAAAALRDAEAAFAALGDRHGAAVARDQAAHIPG